MTRRVLLAGVLVAVVGLSSVPVRGQDLTTRLSYFLKDLYAGTLGVTTAITSYKFTNGTTLADTSGSGKLLLTGSTPMIQVGGTTSSSPALKASNNTLRVRLGDDSADTSLLASFVQLTGSPLITGAVATGTSVGTIGQVQQQTYRVTVSTAAFVCAALTCDVTIATLPAKMFLQHAIGDLTVAFTCASVCTTATLSGTVGKTAGGTQYLLSMDLDAATGQFGDAAAELGASLAPATAPTLLGDVASWSSTTAVVFRLTSGTGNIGTGAATNLGAGSITFYLTTIGMP